MIHSSILRGGPSFVPFSLVSRTARAGAGAWKGGLFAVIAALLVSLVPAKGDELKLASSYKAVGKNGDGSAYTGTVAIKIISSTTFSIDWKIGGSVTHGFGMRMNDTLSATYLLNGEPGLVIYKVAGDGSLSGIWAIKGVSGNGSETLTPKN
jgi:hypothetical protein